MIAGVTREEAGWEVKEDRNQSMLHPRLHQWKKLCAQVRTLTFEYFHEVLTHIYIFKWLVCKFFQSFRQLPSYRLQSVNMHSKCKKNSKKIYCRRQKRKQRCRTCKWHSWPVHSVQQPNRQTGRQTGWLTRRGQTSTVNDCYSNF